VNGGQVDFFTGGACQNKPALHFVVDMSKRPRETTAAVVMDPAELVRRVPLAPHQLTQRLTPQSDLFVLAHLGLPRVEAANWRVEIRGLVERPLTLTLDQIRRRPKRRVQSFHQCAGFPLRPDVATRRVGNVVWGGADLADLLRDAGVDPSARFLWARGADHGDYEGHHVEAYVKDMPLDRLDQGGVLLAYEVNGEPLTLEHGFPLRLIVPGYYGTNAVKWLTRLELRDRRPELPFTTVFYNDPAVPGKPGGDKRPVWAAPPESLIVAPADGASLAFACVEIRGWAWGANGVSSVEISTDGGGNWQAASLDARAEWSWQRFTFTWRPATPGDYRLMARAVDPTGACQPLSAARNAVHEIRVMITGRPEATRVRGK
jgi:DMSO/TMAO reductase YedYZ molybdopterin-dependent catalytic subunit